MLSVFSHGKAGFIPKPFYVAKSGIVTAASTLLLSGGDAVSRAKYEKNVNNLVKLGKAMGQDTTAYRLAEEMDAKRRRGAEVQPYEVQTLYQAAMGEMNKDPADGQQKTAGSETETTGVKKPGGIFTAIAKGKAATRKQVEDYVDYALYYSDVKKSGGELEKQVAQIPISQVSDRLAQDIMDEYGIDLSGRWHCLNDNDIRHINNSHGTKNKTEKYPVSASDIKAIPNIVQNYDDVLFVPHKSGKHGLYYVKRHNGVTYYLEQLLDDGKLVNKQMIKVSTGTVPKIQALRDAIDKKWGLYSAPDENIPRMYVQDAWNRDLTPSIPDATQNSNRNFADGSADPSQSPAAEGRRTRPLQESQGREGAETLPYGETAFWRNRKNNRRLLHIYCAGGVFLWRIPCGMFLIPAERWRPGRRDCIFIFVRRWSCAKGFGICISAAGKR